MFKIISNYNVTLIPDKYGLTQQICILIAKEIICVLY